MFKISLEVLTVETSRGQSRSRSRFLNLSQPTFETCRDYPSCRDHFSVKIFKIETFQLRLICVVIVETYFFPVSRQIETPKLSLKTSLISFRQVQTRLRPKAASGSTFAGDGCSLLCSQCRESQTKLFLKL